MRYSFIIVALDKKINISKVSKSILNICDDCEINYIFKNKPSSVKKNNINENVFIVQTSKEDIAINSVLKEINSNNLILIRENFNLDSIENIELLINKHSNENDIILFKNNNQSKFKTKIKYYLSKCNKLLFDYAFFEGDVSAILFSSTSTSVLKQLKNPAPFTKVNRWIGQDIKYVELPIQNKYSPKENLFKPVAYIGIIALVFIASLLSVIYVPFLQTALAITLIILFLLSLLAINMILILRIYCMKKIGIIENSSCEYERVMFLDLSENNKNDKKSDKKSKKTLKKSKKTK